jgi:hypothetical protein
LLRGREPETPRERRCRRAVEGLLGAAIVVSAALALVDDASRPRGGLAGHVDGEGAVAATGARAGTAGETRAWRPIPVDLAHDPPWRLRLLPGVGPARAAAIVRDRETNGPLPSVEALTRVPGFGERSVSVLAGAGATASARGPP